MAKNKAKTVATWIILGLLFLGLMGFGATNLTGNVQTVATVGEKDLDVQTYARELNQQIRALEAQTGRALPFSEARSMGLDRAVLARLIGQRALDNEAARLGISVGDDLVAREILSIPQFQGAGGDFDREAYAFALDRNGLTEAEFEADLRDEMARALLQSAVVAGIPAPETYAATIADYVGETRSFAWVALAPEDLDEPLAPPTEEELRDFWQENPDLFQRPETRAVAYAWLTPEMIIDEVSVDETALRELYEDRLDEFVRPERRLVERLVFADRTAAQEALAAIEAGTTDFDALVAERGLDLADVDLGDVTRDQLGAAGEPVFGAEPGAVVGPVNTSLGPALFRVNAVLAAEETPFEDALPALREELAAARARRVIEDASGRIEDLLAGGARLEDLAEQTDLQFGRLEFTPGTQTGPAAYTAFREAARTAAAGDFPELGQLEDGGVFALRVEEVRPPETIPFEEAQDRIAAAWRAAQIDTRLTVRAEALAEAVEEADGFTAEMPAPRRETGLTRRGFVAGTPPDFLTQVFAMQPGEARVVDTGDGALVVHLTAVGAADPEAPGTAAEREAVAERTAAGISQDIFDVFTRSLQERTEIEIDQSAINAVHASFQ